MLFEPPEDDTTPELIGIARLAASGQLLASKRRVEYFDLPTRRYLTRSKPSRPLPFEWTINPYRGCEFACRYCYARYTHEFMELRDPVQFETLIFAKQWNEAAFREELRAVPCADRIAIGTATDPYQPAERRFGITRRILKVLAACSGRAVSITTKSDAVARDLDVLRAASARNRITVNMTITTCDEDLARLLEPLAPCPYLRLAAVAKLTRAGIRCGVFCAPVMPGINDSKPSLERVAAAAAEAGASSLMANPLFLQPCSRRVFLPFVEQRFPLLARRYGERYNRSAFLHGEYPQHIAARVEEIARRYGLHRSHRTTPPPPADPGTQLALF